MQKKAASAELDPKMLEVPRWQAWNTWSGRSWSSLWDQTRNKKRCEKEASKAGKGRWIGDSIGLFETSEGRRADQARTIRGDAWLPEIEINKISRNAKRKMNTLILKKEKRHSFVKKSKLSQRWKDDIIFPKKASTLFMKSCSINLLQ